jgi:hypothetical protein
MTTIKTLIYGWLLVILLISCSRKTIPVSTEIIIEEPPPIAVSVSSITSVGKYDSLKIRYGSVLKVKPDQIRNIRLYSFIDEWMYTPYQWGGTSRKGIDCSAFMQRLLKDVYSISIPRTSVQQFHDQWTERFGSKKHLSEGDLVFFSTMEGKLISHVGLYLGNQMFVNSSSSYGVSIASLGDAYWKQRYVAAGRIKQKKATARK